MGEVFFRAGDLAGTVVAFLVVVPDMGDVVDFDTVDFCIVDFCIVDFDTVDLLAVVADAGSYEKMGAAVVRMGSLWNDLTRSLCHDLLILLLLPKADSRLAFCYSCCVLVFWDVYIVYQKNCSHHTILRLDR